VDTESKWRDTDRASIAIWDTAGQTLEGVFQGWRQGPFGRMAIVATRTGLKHFTPNTYLAKLLEPVETGQAVRITLVAFGETHGRRHRIWKVQVAS